MRYFNVMVFVLIGMTVCHGEETVVKSAEMKEGISFTNIELAKAKMAEADYTGALLDLGEVTIAIEDLLCRLYYMRGECHYNMNAFGKAEADYRKSLNNSKTGVAEYMVGKCLLNQGKYHEAYKYFFRALQRLPENAALEDTELKHLEFQYKHDLATTLFEMGRQKEAIQIFHAIQREFPDEDMSVIMGFIENHKKTPKVPAIPSP